MSLIGSLEQFDLANILRRLEVFTKTGLLVVKQGSSNLWVELYFRQGQLVCVGPMRSQVTLVDRLVQAGLLAPQSLNQVWATIQAAGSNETQMAVALINGGHLSHEMLRAWFAHESSQVLQTVFAWPTGEIYFEEDCATPADRLLVGVSVSQLLETIPQTPALRPASANAPSTNEPVVDPFRSPDPTPRGQISAAQLFELSPAQPRTGQVSTTGFLSASQLIDDNPFKSTGSLNSTAPAAEPQAVSFAQDAPPTGGGNLFGSESEGTARTQSFLTPPQPIQRPLPPPSVDTSFLTPELVLMPADLSALREQNPQVQITPEEWRVFALIDGQTSLQALCQTLMAPVNVIRQLVGELMAIGLVVPLTQMAGAATGYGQPVMPPVQPPQVLYSGQTGSHYAAPPQTGRPNGGPMGTQSQWGNGNTNATFMVGNGWMLTPGQALPQSGGTYASATGYR